MPFAQAAAGVIGLETLLPVSLELHHRGELSLLDLLARMTIAPADAPRACRRDGSPRARRPTWCCSTWSAPTRSMLPSSAASRRTRRSTSGRCRAACSAPSSTAAPCSRRRAEGCLASSRASRWDGRTCWRCCSRLSAGLDPVRPDPDAAGRPRRHPPDRLRQYRRHQRAAHRQQGAGGGNADPRRRQGRGGGAARQHLSVRMRRSSRAPAPSSAISFRSG